jgi:predicted alpha/beta hydrolase
VAATSAWWGNWPAPLRWGILGFYGTAPILGRLIPYFPADLVDFGPNVESHIVRDWVRWGRHRRYFYGPFDTQPQMEQYRGHVLALSFTDDVNLGCERAVHALHRHFRIAKLEYRHLAPKDFGLDSVGHFGFFRRAQGPALWTVVDEWIEQCSRGLR